MTRLGGEILYREVLSSHLSCRLTWLNQAPVCSLLNLYWYILILYLDNQVIVVNDIPNNQYHDNENLMNENTTLVSGNVGLTRLSVNIPSSINFVHCKGCRKNRHPNFFYDLPQNKTYKQCSDCRHRKFVRRNPLSMQTRSVALPQSNDNCESYIIVSLSILIYRKCLRVLKTIPS